MRAEFPGHVTAPAAARRWVAAAIAELAGSRGSLLADDVVLVVSELVTNSVRAEATTIGLELAVAEDRIELEVTDDAPGWPSVRQPEWDATQGRGLAIVADVADSWFASTADPGKRVTVVWSRWSAGAD